MEEELSENELEEQFYSMLYYEEDKEPSQPQDALSFIENAPRSTVRRYWRTSEDQNTLQNNVYQKTNPATQKVNTTYQKINSPTQKTNTPNQKTNVTQNNITVNQKTNNLNQKSNNPNNTSKPKEERNETPPPADPLPGHLSIFQSTTPQNVKKTIEIIENDEYVVDLESSDEDEVVEVALPPKPTIMIESSDEEESVVSIQETAVKDKLSQAIQDKTANVDREVSASPVPSIVSSVSDEFIRSDCIALNISSRHQDDHSFDFGLHGADLLGTPAKKKKKKKNKEATSTPVAVEPALNNDVSNSIEYFATPKSKAKNKKQKMNDQPESVKKSVPITDVYDSDSNQSIIDISKNRDSYIVTEKSLPSADVYESDSSQSETVKETEKPAQIKNKSGKTLDSSDSSASLDKIVEEPINRIDFLDLTQETMITVDLTNTSVPLDNSDIQENIVMANVTGFEEYDDYGDDPVIKTNVTRFESTKVPAILYQNLDFDNLKGKDKVCRNRRFSPTTLRAEMEKFYNESWGGEDFNHRELQKNMSRDKSLWAIDPKDRMPSMSRKKQSCNYCNRTGHRDDMCQFKPPVCYMCGFTGHVEPRCPRKICVNCGTPNRVFTNMCRNCAPWNRINCMECGQTGHPASHCPDLWRRYHNTITLTNQLDQSHTKKKLGELYCSGCTRRGHLVHTCRITLPFSGLPINSPFTHCYRPIYYCRPERNEQNEQNLRNHSYQGAPQDSPVKSDAVQFQNERNKRQSKSPTIHESHVSKKAILSTIDGAMLSKNLATDADPLRKISQSLNDIEVAPDNTAAGNVSENVVTETQGAPDFIPIGSPNHDKQGQIIQDNEVSDTSDVVTSARIYVTKDVLDGLKTEEGEKWLKNMTDKHNLTVQNSDIQLFLSIKGKVGDQEAFQSVLRERTKNDTNTNSVNNTIVTDSENMRENEPDLDSYWLNIPKHKNNILQILGKALNSLSKNIGEPNAIYKELIYLQSCRTKILKQKAISQKKLTFNKNCINDKLKKLNKILLGQAGLASGPRHLSELYSIQKDLLRCSDQVVSVNIRKEIGEHYHSIFSAIPRNDYAELLDMYYSKMTFSKKRIIPLNVSHKKKIRAIPSQQNNPSKDVETRTNNKQNIRFNRAYNTDVSRLASFHKRLTVAKPNDAVLKKTRLKLVRKLHICMSSMCKQDKPSSKMVKKMMILQEQAQLFLTNNSLRQQI